MIYVYDMYTCLQYVYFYSMSLNAPLKLIFRLWHCLQPHLTPHVHLWMCLHYKGIMGSLIFLMGELYPQNIWIWIVHKLFVYITTIPNYWIWNTASPSFYLINDLPNLNINLYYMQTIWYFTHITKYGLKPNVILKMTFQMTFQIFQILFGNKHKLTTLEQENYSRLFLSWTCKSL